MQLILITGLDGSGKSTLINKLEKSSNSADIAFLRVPTIESNLFKSNDILYKTSCFINNLHLQADVEKIPQLKVIAMFSSMLIFGKLLKELEKKGAKLVFCERHPLVDTPVYAHFYSGSMMNPKNMNEYVLEELNQNYSEELKYLLSLLQLDAKVYYLSHLLLNFIHEKFSKKGIITIPELEQIFNIGTPDKIYYLDAKPEILMQRLITRQSNLEAHETQKAFEKMIPVYYRTINSIDADMKIIDASSYKSLDMLFRQIISAYAF